MGAGAEAVSAVSLAAEWAGPGQVDPEQVGQHGRIIEAGVAEGQQQPAAAALERLHRRLQPLHALHPHAAQAGPVQPQRQQPAGAGQHPAVQPGRDEFQGGGAGHRWT